MLKVLIAEDELMIADLLEETLIMSGYEVCGIARTVVEAVALANLHKPDLAWTSGSRKATAALTSLGS